MKLIKQADREPKAKLLVSVGDEIFYYPPTNIPAFDGIIEHVPPYSHQAVVTKVSNKTFEVQDRIGRVYRVYIEYDRFQVIKRALETVVDYFGDEDSLLANQCQSALAKAKS